MKAIKATGIVNNQGQLCLDHPLEINKNSRVEVIVLIEEESEDDETPDDQILADFRQSWQEAMTGKTIPVSQLWEDIEND
jgi:hypothetical protein